MSNFFSRIMGKSAPATRKVAMITNFSACPLGIQLAAQLENTLIKPDQSDFEKLILVAPNATQYEKGQEGVHHFDAFVNEAEDRIRLMAYLKEENMKIGALIHNQPYMLEPNKDRVETAKSKLK